MTTTEQNSAEGEFSPSFLFPLVRTLHNLGPMFPAPLMYVCHNVFMEITIVRNGNEVPSTEVSSAFEEVGNNPNTVGTRVTLRYPDHVEHHYTGENAKAYGAWYVGKHILFTDSTGAPFFTF